MVYTIGHDHISQTTFGPSEPVEGTTLVFHMDGHGSTRILTDLAGTIANLATPQIFHYTAYGQAINFTMSEAATQYLYSGEQFDSRVGQQYLRARYYNQSTGAFNRLDPFFGNQSDPQSFHKYLYTHGDPSNGFDPSGLFLTTIGSLVSNSIASAKRGLTSAADFALLQTIRGSIYLSQAISNIRILNAVYGYGATALGFIYFHAQYIAYRFSTWLPKIQTAAEVLDVGFTFLDAASIALRDTARIIDGLNQFDRGNLIEDIAGANLTGNVKGIDDVRYTENGDGFVTSVRSHDVANESALVKAIRKDANELFDKSYRDMDGYDPSGRYRVVPAEDVKGKGLLVVVPGSWSNRLRSVAAAIDQIAEATETVIRVVPMKRWKGKKR